MGHARPMLRKHSPGALFVWNASNTPNPRPYPPSPRYSKSELLLLREFRDATSGRIVFEPEASYIGFVGMCVNKYE